ncbi:hypothetical protein [Kribbella sp. NPDC048915]|uniref:hypothetical protein n=1 Tax=Kribbella sp. NPDC048915 TaxID=3155148 RepID=UPI0034056E41
MRTTAAERWMVAGAMAAFLLVFGGIVLAAIGGIELWHRSGEYKVGFRSSGDDCGIEKVEISVRSGKPLFCTTPGVIVPSTWKASFTGFTDDQNADVFELALELAKDDGLSEADQRQIQFRVDAYAGTVPPERRRQHPSWSGKNRVATGVIALSLGAAGLAVAHSAIRPRGR